VDHDGLSRLMPCRVPGPGIVVGVVSLGPLPLLRIEEHWHGHLGWLAVAALLHPAVVLRRLGRRADLAVGLGTALVTIAGALGVDLYGPYRSQLRRSIFVSAPSIGYLFERKEHLAFGAVLMAWAGAASYVAARSAEEPVRGSFWRASHWAFIVAAGLATVTASLGTVIAAYRTF
jgi:hypothetical protein